MTQCVVLTLRCYGQHSARHTMASMEASLYEWVGVKLVSPATIYKKESIKQMPGNHIGSYKNSALI